MHLRSRSNIPALFALAILALPALAYAQPSFEVWCGNLPGCSSGTGWQDFSVKFFDFLVSKLPQYAQPLGILFLVIGAGYMLLNLGDEQRIETGKKTVIWSLVGIMVALFAEEFVTLLQGETFVDESAQNDILFQILSAFERILYEFFFIALLAAIVFNAFRMVFARGSDEEFGKAKRGLIWASFGAVLLNVLHRLVPAVVNMVENFNLL